MTDEKKPVSFAAGCYRFFGRNGKGIGEFAVELKALNQADRTEIAYSLSKELGEEVSPN